MHSINKRQTKKKNKAIAKSRAKFDASWLGKSAKNKRNENPFLVRYRLMGALNRNEINELIDQRKRLNDFARTASKKTKSD